MCFILQTSLSHQNMDWNRTLLEIMRARYQEALYLCSFLLREVDKMLWIDFIVLQYYCPKAAMYLITGIVSHEYVSRQIESMVARY